MRDGEYVLDTDGAHFVPAVHWHTINDAGARVLVTSDDVPAIVSADAWRTVRPAWRQTALRAP